MLCSLCQSNNPAQAQRCRACGAPLRARAGENGAHSPDALPAGTLLAGAYAVEDVLGQGGFGITYCCHDRMLDRRVAVKEFFPSGCRRHDTQVQPSRGLSDADFREARTQFLAEARVLARCHHVGIVGVHAAFEANSTAYMVMELLHGKTLAQLLTARGGRMDETEAVGIIERVGEALSFVHDLDLLHRDIKPDNIIVCDDGRVMLIDFGTAREWVKGQAQGQTVVVTPGYAPLEQYARQAKRGAFTDVYGLAATLYHLLTGQMPPAASDRAMGVQLRSVREINPQISASVARATETALQMEIAKRPQSVREFLDLLHAPVENLKPEVSPLMQRATHRVDSLHSDDKDSESFFAPQSLDFARDNNDRASDEIPAVLSPDVLRAQQQAWQNAIPVANTQPVKLAPPHAFSGAVTPPDATTFSHLNSGGVAVQNSADSEAPSTFGWWMLGVIGFLALLALFNSGGHERNVTSGSYSGPVTTSPVHSSPSFTYSDVENSKSEEQKRLAAQRDWDALPIINPASVETLPVSESNAAPMVNYPAMGDVVEFSPDGTRVAYIDNQAVLRVLTLPNRRVVRSLQLDKNFPPSNLMFSPDNETIAVGQRQKIDTKGRYTGVTRTEVWNLRTGKRVGALNVASSENYTYPQAMLNDSQLLVQEIAKSRSNNEAELSLWNPKTEKTTKTPLSIPYIDQMSYKVISPDGKKLVVGYSSGLLRWLDLRSGKQEAERPMAMTWGNYQSSFGNSYSGADNFPLGVRGIDYSLNGSYLASRSSGEIRVFDSKPHKIGSLTIDANNAMNFSMSPDGKWLAARGNLPFSPESTLLWNVRTGQKIRLQAPSEQLLDFGFSPDGKQLYGIFAQGKGFQFVTWNVDANPIQNQTFALFDTTSFSSVQTAAGFPSPLPVALVGELVAFPNTNFVEIRQQDGTWIRTLNTFSPDVSAMELSPDGRFLGIRADDGAIQIWEARNGNSVLGLKAAENANQPDVSSPNYQEKPRDIAFSPDNNYFAGARFKGDLQIVELWSLQNTPRLLASFAQKEPVSALTFSLDGKGLICGGQKGTLQWYDVATRRAQTQIKTGEPIFDIAFGARNLVVMGDSTTTLYQVPAKSTNPLERASRTKLPANFDTGRDVFTPSSISADGKLMAISQGYKGIQIWQLPSGTMLQGLLPNQNGENSVIHGLNFSADSTQLTAVSQKLGASQLQITTYKRSTTR